MVYSQRNSVWQLRRNRNPRLLFYDVIYDTLRENMLGINTNIWIPHLKEHFNQQIQNTEFTVFSMALHHRIASETIGYHCKWQHQNLMIHLTFLSCLKCVKLLQTTDRHNHFLNVTAVDYAFFSWICAFYLQDQLFVGTTDRICSCFPKSRVLVYGHILPY